MDTGAAQPESSARIPLEAADPAWAADPIDVLLQEHRTILQVLDEVERESRRLENEGTLRESFWLDLLRFAEEFDARLHHHKEEQLLFPVLEQKGLDDGTGPTAVLRDEHRRVQVWLQRIREALRARDRSRLAASVAHYLDVMRAHILKENQIAFPLARRLLSGDERRNMLRRFAEFRAELRIDAWLPPAAAAWGIATRSIG